MKWVIGLLSITVFLPCAANSAEVAMRRVLLCTGPDATIEVYVPESVWSGAGVENVRIDNRVLGAYALDLSAAGKGKTLEPVYLKYSKNRKAIVVHQYTRKLPVTLVAVDGATVDFDQRSATNAKCGAFNQ